MSDKADGGAAFPVLHEIDGNWIKDPRPEYMGMSLRDWFAGQAPNTPEHIMEVNRRSDHLRNPHNDSYKPKLRSDAEIDAAYRYAWADAMLAARQK